MADLDQTPIIDAHHHYWDPRDGHHPWLSGSQQIPFRYGDYSAICRPFLPEDYAAGRDPQLERAIAELERSWTGTRKPSFGSSLPARSPAFAPYIPRFGCNGGNGNGE